MSKWRDEYFQEYTVEKEILPSGRKRRLYVYHGNYYFWREPEKVSSLKKEYAGLFALNLVVYFLTTLGNTQPSHTKYLAVPALLALIAMMFELYAIVQFCMVKEKVREFEFNDLNTKLLGSTVSNAALTSAAGIVSLYYAALTSLWLPYALTAIGFSVCAGCAIAVYRLHKSLHPVLVEEGEGAENYKKRRLREEAQSGS